MTRWQLWIGGLRKYVIQSRKSQPCKNTGRALQREDTANAKALPAWQGHSELGWYEGTAFITVALSLLTNFKHILWGRPVLVSENTDK